MNIADLANSLGVSYKEAAAWDAIFDFLDRFSIFENVRDLERFVFEYKNAIYPIPKPTLDICKKLLEKHGRDGIRAMFCLDTKEKKIKDFVRWAKGKGLRPIDFAQRGILVPKAAAKGEIKSGVEIVYEVAA